MKHLILVSLLLVSLPVAASNIRIDGELIRPGTTAMVVLDKLGNPAFINRVYSCPDRTCAPDYETWQYRLDNLNYQIRMRGGRVEKIDWSRF